MLTRKKTIWTISLLAVMYLAYFLFSLNHYSFTGLGAARKHFDVGKDARVIEQVSLAWGKVYVMQTPKGPRTVMAVKEGPLWRAPAATYMDNSSDAVRTVGWMSYHDFRGSVTLFAVENYDPRVKYIEVNKLRKELKVNKTIVFWWPEQISLNELKPEAFSGDGKVLYEYRFPTNNHVTYAKDLKWYPAGDVK